MTDSSPVITPDGTQTWYQNNLIHRDNDLPAIIYSYGRQVWFQNGQRQSEGEIDGQYVKGCE